MEQLKPAVTVGMPVFNGERHVREAIESVLTQTRGDFELLISDNSSTDRTAAICREYAARDRRIRFVEQDKNRGAYWNFQFVTEQATGDFLVWLAHDGTLEARYNEETEWQLNENYRVVIVCGDVRVIDDYGAQIDIETLVTIRDDIDWQQRCSEFYKYPISNALFSIYGMMRANICREVLRSVKPRRQMAQFELPILARFAAKGQISSLPIVLRTYRRHDASLYNTEARALWKESRVKRLIVGHAHIAKMRFGQIRVLLCSSMSYKFKIRVLLDVAKFYSCRLTQKIRRASSGAGATFT